MGHEVRNPLRAALLHDGGHALVATGVAYVLMWLFVVVLSLPIETALLLSGVLGWLVPSVVQEGIDTRWFRSVTADSVHDVATYAPILGLNLLLAGQTVAGLAVLALVALVEAVFYWKLIQS